MTKIIPKGLYCGEITVPPSKSILHRALICAAFADGESVIHNFAVCDDVIATVECLRKLGAAIKIKGSDAVVKGTSVEDIPDGVTLDCRESGSTLRFLIPFAIISGKTMRFKGSERLLSRPMEAYQTLCDRNGIDMHIEDGALFVSGEKLENGFFTVDGSVSSQFVSGLMLALPHLHGYSVIEVEGETVSKPYIAMTLSVLSSFGVNLSVSDRIVVPSCAGTLPTEYTAEGDWSAAAPLFALNAVGSEITVKGLENASCQGDRAIKLLLGRLKRGKAEIDVTDCPDLAPVLMAVAPFFYGAHLTGTDRLEGKESDRGRAMAEELGKFGVPVTVGEGFIDVGEVDEFPEDVTVSSRSDHRIAMALTVILSYTGGKVEGEEHVSKSFPDFFTLLDQIREK
ncbi:MAG: 3-phosphoshikimate 1-carboxyvinyltransferase [Firmicutes bacterium]|nr:3-phosphoshikimate 1-carboxyvinyltransferase [Candidatus Colimorpha enterica]